jgi:PPOX class probable F420-dependent enzyme
MSHLPDNVKAILESPALAHLVTLEPDGSPQVSIIWVGHLAERRKVRNIRRDPRVVLSFETDTVNKRGLLEYLVLHGTAHITEGGAPELLQRLAHVYLGPDVVFPPPEVAQPGFITHITVDRISGVGPWAG